VIVGTRTRARTPLQTHHDLPIAELLRRIDGQLLPQLRLRSVDPHEPVKVLSLPQPWRQLGCGNDAAALHHPDHPALAVKV
jgi:hypothetical protein